MEITAPPRGEVLTSAAQRRLGLSTATVAAVAATAVAALMGVTGAAEQPALVAALRGLMVGVPLGVGLYAWRRHPDERFGLLLTATGAVCLITTLAESDDALSYTIGRWAGWYVVVMVAALVLAFPTGRLSGRTDRLLAGTMAAVVAVTNLPRLVLDTHFITPSPYTSCVENCPHNVFSLVNQSTEPAFVDAFLVPLSRGAVALVMAAIVVRVAVRTAGASYLMRRIYLPVLVLSAVHTAMLALIFAGWEREAASWLIALSIPGLSLAVLAGLLRWSLFEARALECVGRSLGRTPDPATLRDVLAQAFDDPELRVAFLAPDRPDGWADADGWPIAVPCPGDGRCMTDVRDGGAVVAALVHDEALRSEPKLLAAGAAMAGAVLAHGRLVSESGAALREVHRSRARMTRSIEGERRRIERALHDGAQQRLVALRIELPLAADLVRRDPERGIERLHRLQDAVEDALEDVRAVAHGVYPPLLADRGVAEALRALVARASVPVELTVGDLGRHAPAVETAVYLCVLDALANLDEHVPAPAHAVVDVQATPDALRFVVRAEAANGAPVHPAATLERMRDRLEAVGGDLMLTARRPGTVLRGQVPVS
jgi:signal transduction histidine kinase